MKYWRGVKGVTMIWHGNYSDPELQIKQGCFTCRINYWDVEDWMYELCIEEYGIEYAKIDSNFNKFCQENRWRIIEDIKQFGKWERI